jgi:hypothetical protein
MVISIGTITRKRKPAIRLLQAFVFVVLWNFKGHSRKE